MSVIKYYIIRIGCLYYSNSNNDVINTGSIEQAKEFTTLEEVFPHVSKLVSLLKFPITIIPCFHKKDWVIVEMVCTDKIGINKLQQLVDNSNNIFIKGSTNYL